MKKIILMLILTAKIVFSQDIPRYIAYQGVLIDKNKQLKPDKTYSFSFKLYDSQSNGNLVWPLVPNVQTLLVTNGIFSTLIGPLDNIEFSKPFYLDITVDGEQFPQRILLYSSPYALGIANNSVSNSKIQNNAVTEDKIADNSITNKKLADGAVSSSKIQNGEVIETKLADKSVSSRIIQANSVIESKISDNSVSNRTIQTNSIDSNKIIDKSVSYNDLSISSASTGNVLTYNNNTWQPQAPSGVPVGTIMAFYGNESQISSDWLLCDGKTVSATYPLLQQHLITLNGTAILPDLRGRFLRGNDSTSVGRANNDPDYNSRTGTNKVGSYQDDALKRHTHGMYARHYASAGGTYNDSNLANGTGTLQGAAVPISDENTPTYNETRPKNIAVNWIIKAK